MSAECDGGCEAVSERMRIKPSLTSADPLRLGEALDATAAADSVHVNIVDGHYCPNIAFGPALVRAVKGRTNLPVEVHLMVENPGDVSAWMLDAGADAVVFHLETCAHPLRLLAAIRVRGARAGVALAPATPPDALAYVLPAADAVLVMGVEPGFGGQTMLETTFAKVAVVRRMIDETGCAAELMVDGGVSAGNIGRLAACGARTFCLGSAVFGADDPARAVCGLRDAAVRGVAREAVLLR